MIKALRTTKGRIFIAVSSSVALVVTWLAMDGSFAILPAVMMPFWIPVFTRQKEPASPGSRRFMLVSILVGILLLALLAGVYVARN